MEVILHHYPTSPYAEKVRIALGIKALAWRSVIIPVIMPKPDLIPLTGGYRKTPVMQIGADVYCDTQCILRELERRFPTRSLYQGANAGLVNALAFGGDRNLFTPAVTVVFAARDGMLPGLIEDRSRMVGRELSIAKMKTAAPFALDQLRAQLAWYETALEDDRTFLLGPHPTLADCALYHPCWFIASNLGASAAPLDELPRLRAWMERVKAIGHGEPTELTSREALLIAASAAPEPQQTTDAHDPLARKPGMKVQVTPDDTGRDPVVGELVASTSQAIVLRRADPQVGDVHVHFPRAGFIVQPAQ